MKSIYLFIFEKQREAPAKSPRLIKTEILPVIQTVEIVTPAPSLVDYNDLLDAMEQLVERLNELVSFKFCSTLRLFILINYCKCPCRNSK